MRSRARSKLMRHLIVREMGGGPVKGVTVTCTGDRQELGQAAEETAHEEATAAFLSSTFCLLLPGTGLLPCPPPLRLRTRLGRAVRQLPHRVVLEGCLSAQRRLPWACMLCRRLADQPASARGAPGWLHPRAGRATLPYPATGRPGALRALHRPVLPLLPAGGVQRNTCAPQLDYFAVSVFFNFTQAPWLNETHLHRKADPILRAENPNDAQVRRARLPSRWLPPACPRCSPRARGCCVVVASRCSTGRGQGSQGRERPGDAALPPGHVPGGHRWQATEGGGGFQSAAVCLDVHTTLRGCCVSGAQPGHASHLAEPTPQGPPHRRRPGHSGPVRCLSAGVLSCDSLIQLLLLLLVPCSAASVPLLNACLCGQGGIGETRWLGKGKQMLAQPKGLKVSCFYLLLRATLAALPPVHGRWAHRGQRMFKPSPSLSGRVTLLACRAGWRTLSGG